ncbi:hypothetical protein AB0C27_10615 [Nonomuraea sp. NPDC048882]|uniref:hypothetical protein n=1 Tax=unclassified Nonomuraea TaxID=2593643 RepID=UPI0033D9D763
MIDRDHGALSSGTFDQVARVPLMSPPALMWSDMGNMGVPELLQLVVIGVVVFLIVRLAMRLRRK